MNALAMRVDNQAISTGIDAHAAEIAERRRSGRIAAIPDITVVIKGKDVNFKPWSETASVTSLSTSGAGFFMSAECPVGRLVSIMLPMPAHLRRYDLDKKLYRVWGLVQYCYEAGGEEEAGFHVGVALIGRDAPRSYTRNPMQSYRISGMDKSGLWKIKELDSAFTQRASVRYWNAIETVVYKLDESQRSTESEMTVTENISESGALVFCELSLSVGDCIKFQTSTPSFTSLSIVRHRRIGADNRTRVHLEFIEGTFPIIGIESPIEDRAEA